MSKHAATTTGHIVRHHGLYRRVFVLFLATCLILYVAHWLEVTFAAVNLLHFLEVDDVMAKYGL